MRILSLSILLAGCASRPAIPAQPEAPTTQNSLNKLEAGIDSRSSKVAAAVSVARENAEKPEIVRSEAGVALSFLPPPAEGDLALARQRVTKADQKDYDEAVKFGKVVLAQIGDYRAKMDADQREAARVSKLKDERIASLSEEIERVKKEAAANVWTMTGAGLVIIGGLACAFASARVGIPVILCGAFAGALPFFFDSPYFLAISITSIAVIAGLGIWWVYDRVRDSVHESDGKKKK